jgi:hypothetical protein
MQYKIKTAVIDDLMLTQSSIGTNSNNTPTISSCIVQRPTHPLLHCEEANATHCWSGYALGQEPWTAPYHCPTITLDCRPVRAAYHSVFSCNN